MSSQNTDFAPIPQVRFDSSENLRLTSFAGLVIYQKLFQKLQLGRKLKNCFQHLSQGTHYQMAQVFLGLVVQILLGFRCLRDRDFYAEDPLVCRLLDVEKLPDTSTISRVLAKQDQLAVQKVRNFSTNLVLERLKQEQPARVTLDFDGSVAWTTRHAEGTAVGFNKQKKGTRSYYPLYCTVAQTGQFLDCLYRSGNVHDSNGAVEFSHACFERVRECLPQAILESRIDSAFFQESLLSELDAQGVEFTASVPWARFPELKAQTQSQRNWIRINQDWSYFVIDWKPTCWQCEFRMIVIRQNKKQPIKGPLQLDLFEPVSREYEYSMIVTNKLVSAPYILDFHHGRGTQEGIFAEAKSHCQLDYIPVRKQAGNQIYCLAAMVAHNLTRELQMDAEPRARTTTRTRSPLWSFDSLRTIRHRLLRRAGRLLYPQGRYTLSLSTNQAAEAAFEKYLAPNQAA